MGDRVSAIFAHGHWRRRDPLEGLTPAMIAAMRVAASGDFLLRDGLYQAVTGESHPPVTIAALAERGLLRLSCGPEGRERRFVITRRGREIAAEIHRRAQVRARLTRSPA